MADNKTLWTWGNQQKYHTEIIEELDKKFEENDLASVAISGSYNDLTDTPEIPTITIDSELSDTSENPVQNKVIKTELDKKLDKTGGTMKGTLIAQSNTDYTTAQVRNATMSTSAASGGSNGQIHYQYE